MRDRELPRSLAYQAGTGREYGDDDAVRLQEQQGGNVIGVPEGRELSFVNCAANSTNACLGLGGEFGGKKW